VRAVRRAAFEARTLYEDLYCACGEAENRIDEQFELFADRASSATMAANQLRLWFVLVNAMRHIALHPVCRCLSGHHPSQAAQARRPRAHQCVPRLFRHHLKLSEPG
jgi:Transposase DDE domain group 1